MYNYPEEHDFTWEGFGLNTDHSPDEAVFSYIYQYGAKELYFVHSIWGRNPIRVKIIENEKEIIDLYLEGEARSIEFLGVKGNKFIRVLFKNQEKELKVFYDPEPKVIFNYVEN